MVAVFIPWKLPNVTTQGFPFLFFWEPVKRLSAQYRFWNQPALDNRAEGSRVPVRGRRCPIINGTATIDTATAREAAVAARAPSRVDLSLVKKLKLNLTGKMWGDKIKYIRIIIIKKDDLFSSWWVSEIPTGRGKWMFLQDQKALPHTAAGVGREAGESEI